jgi:hypothetical protein
MAPPACVAKIPVGVDKETKQKEQMLSTLTTLPMDYTHSFHWHYFATI